MGWMEMYWQRCAFQEVEELSRMEVPPWEESRDGICKFWYNFKSKTF